MLFLHTLQIVSVRSELVTKHTSTIYLSIATPQPLELGEPVNDIIKHIRTRPQTHSKTSRSSVKEESVERELKKLMKEIDMIMDEIPNLYDLLTDRAFVTTKNFFVA